VADKRRASIKGRKDVYTKEQEAESKDNLVAP